MLVQQKGESDLHAGDHLPSAAMLLALHVVLAMGVGCRSFK